MKKYMSLILALTIVFYFLIFYSQSYATQSREPQSSKLDNYPGYSQLINNLKQAHPNWNFTILYTGLDWSQVIKNETVALHGRNLVESNKGSDWICSTCGDTPYDGRWRCASEAAVSYYMDPRNSLKEDYVFQFENLSYNPDIQTRAGVETILAPCNYMQGTITYVDINGNTQTIGKTYIDVIMEAAAEYNVSPYHLASRIRQEIGTGNGSVIVSGTYNGYTGYYNYYNIGATGANQIASGLEYAKSKTWTDPEKAIKGGASFLASGYISTGQDTLYLQKFDVDDSDGSLYSYQYMQNVSASKTEGNSVKLAYETMGMLNGSINFVVPVYENMPQEACRIPGTNNIVTQNVQINGMQVRIREGKGTNYAEIATLNTGDKLLRIEIANNIENGYYWDKVVLPDGRKGYVARDYLQKIDDITTCNESVIATTGVYLRNGPGTNNTTTIMLLVQNQKLTRITHEEYDVDGYKWDRVKLSDGTQGYVATNYLQLASDNTGNAGENTGNEGEATNETIRVICPSGLWVRNDAGTDKSRLTYLDTGDTATRIAKNVSNVNGYIWDKIITNDGITGYIARGDSSGDYIEVVSTPNVNPPVDSKDKGDLDLNGIVDVVDMLYMQKQLIGSISLKDQAWINADMDNNGIVDVVDMLYMQQKLIST